MAGLTSHGIDKPPPSQLTLLHHQPFSRTAGLHLVGTDVDETWHYTLAVSPDGNMLVQPHGRGALGAAFRQTAYVNSWSARSWTCTLGLCPGTEPCLHLLGAFFAEDRLRRRVTGHGLRELVVRVALAAHPREAHVADLGDALAGQHDVVALQVPAAPQLKGFGDESGPSSPLPSRAKSGSEEGRWSLRCCRRLGQVTRIEVRLDGKSQARQHVRVQPSAQQAEDKLAPLTRPPWCPHRLDRSDCHFQGLVIGSIQDLHEQSSGLMRKNINFLDLCTTPLVCRKCSPREMSSAIDLPGPAHRKALSSRVVSACRRSPPCAVQVRLRFSRGHRGLRLGMGWRLESGLGKTFSPCLPGVVQSHGVRSNVAALHVDRKIGR